MGAQRTIIRLAIAVAMFLLFVLKIGGALPLPFVDQVERSTYDARILLTMPKTVDAQVVIIDIDEKSITAEGHWPWSRDKFATLIREAPAAISCARWVSTLPSPKPTPARAGWMP